MGRRSDHTRSELEALFLEKGWQHLGEVGLARFSAREVAKRAGYSIGSIYNVFGSYDRLVLAINARTLLMWAGHLRARLGEPGCDPIETLVHGYFEFARAHPRNWMAIFEHHLEDDTAAPDWDQAAGRDLMDLVAEQIVLALPKSNPATIRALAPSLVATVHGHCVFTIFRTFDVLGETDPVRAALTRVREALAAAARD